MKPAWAPAVIAVATLLWGCDELTKVESSPGPSPPPVGPAPDPEPEPEKPQRINVTAPTCLKITAVDAWPDDPGAGTDHVWENVRDQEIIVIFCQDSYTTEGVERKPSGAGAWGTQRDCGIPAIGPEYRVLVIPPWFYNSAQPFYNRYSLPLKPAGSAYGVKTYIPVQHTYLEPFGSWRVTYRYGVCYANTELPAGLPPDDHQRCRRQLLMLDRIVELEREDLFLWGFLQLIQCQDPDGFRAIQGWFLRNFPEVRCCRSGRS